MITQLNQLNYWYKKHPFVSASHMPVVESCKRFYNIASEYYRLIVMHTYDEIPEKFDYFSGIFL